MERYRPAERTYYDHIGELLTAVGGTVDTSELRDKYGKDADYVKAAV